MSGDPIKAIRAHVEKHTGKERATFSIAGIKALLAEIDKRDQKTGRAAQAAPEGVPCGGVSRQDKVAVALPGQAVAPVACKSCKGTGTEADYVGDDMRAVEVECSFCKGTGFAPVPAQPVAGDLAELIERLSDAIEGECDGLAINEDQAKSILDYVGVTALQAENERLQEAYKQQQARADQKHEWALSEAKRAASAEAELSELRSEQARWTPAVLVNADGTICTPSGYVVSAPCAGALPKPDVLYIDGAVYRRES